MRRKRLFALVCAALVAVLLAGCTVPPPPGPAPLRYRDVVFPDVSVTRDLQYGSAPDLNGNPVSLTLDLYQPAGDSVARRPAIVWVHGGGFTAGDKASGAGFATYFAQRGYVVVSINYRLLSPDGCGGQPDPPDVCLVAAQAAQHDGQAAVRWLRRNAATYRIDRRRIAMGGSSAGGVTSLAVNWRPEDPGTSGNPGYSSRIQASISVSGGSPTNAFIDAGDSPGIFFHGTADRTVPYWWAVQNAGAMYNAGILTVLESFEGAGHGIIGPYRGVIFPQSANFLYIALDLSRASSTSSAARRAYPAYERKLREQYPGRLP